MTPGLAPDLFARTAMGAFSRPRSTTRSSIASRIASRLSLLPVVFATMEPVERSFYYAGSWLAKATLRSSILTDASGGTWKPHPGIPLLPGVSPKFLENACTFFKEQLGGRIERIEPLTLNVNSADHTIATFIQN